MATNIDEIEWSSLHHATGTCEHVPAALLDLVSDSEERRNAAYWQLDNHVIVQGDLYQAAPFVAEALIALLREGVSRGTRAYDLLVELANGSAPETHTVAFKGRCVSLKTATMECIMSGRDVYERDLRSGDRLVRAQAVTLLLSLSEFCTLDMGELQQLRDDEADPSVRALLDELILECKGGSS